MAVGEGDKVKNDSNFTPGRVVVIVKANLEMRNFFSFFWDFYFFINIVTRVEKHHSSISLSKNMIF